MNARDIFIRRIRAVLAHVARDGGTLDEQIDPDAVAEELGEHVTCVAQSYRVPAKTRAAVVEYLAERCWCLHDVPGEETDALQLLALVEHGMGASGASAPLIHWPTDVSMDDVAAVIARARDPNARVMSASLRGGQWFVVGPNEKGGRLGSMCPKPELYTKTASDPREASNGWVEFGDERLSAAIQTIYHPFFAALIAHAEKAIRAMRGTRCIFVDASQVHSRMLSHWADTPTDRHGVALPLTSTREERQEGFKIIVEDDNLLQLSLPLDGITSDIVNAVQRARGHEGVRHWSAILHLFSIKGGRTGRVTWTVDDHMRVLGYSAETMRDPKVRKRIVQEVIALARLLLTVYDKSGDLRWRRPLLLKVDDGQARDENGAWTIEGMTLEMHPALWEGVQLPDGKYGTNWFPASPDLPKLHHKKYPHAIVLGLRVPQRLRWVMPKGVTHIDLSGQKALEFAGIHPRRGHHPGRVWETFNTNVSALQALPMPGVGPVEWVRGTPNTVQGMVRFHAAPWQRVMTHHRLTHIEAPPLPKTGAELRTWREARGLTQADIARALGVGIATVKRAEGAPRAALPRSIRATIDRGLLPTEARSLPATTPG